MCSWGIPRIYLRTPRGVGGDNYSLAPLADRPAPRPVGVAAYRWGVPEPVSPAQVEVRRSQRRRRTVSAYRDGDTVVVLLPAKMTKADERHWVAEMLRRLERSEARRGSRRRASDADLMLRAKELSTLYLQGRAVPNSVRWVPPMRTRWGSATPADGTIRLSERLRATPAWVVDYVLVHELAHLIEPGHTPRFWELVGHYPRTERAIGFLHGLSVAAGLGITGTDGDPDDSAGDPDDVTDDSAGEPGGVTDDEPADEPAGGGSNDFGVAP